MVKPLLNKQIIGIIYLLSFLLFIISYIYNEFDIISNIAFLIFIISLIILCNKNSKIRYKVLLYLTLLFLTTLFIIKLFNNIYHHNYYLLFIYIAFMINIIITIFKYKSYSINERIGLIIFELIGMVYGAKLLNYAINYSAYKGSFNFFFIGYSSYGGIIGFIISIYLYTLLINKSIKELLLFYLPVIPLMYGISKIGCFLTGCCYGIKYNGFGNIIYKNSLSAPNNVSLFPIQLVESIFFIIISLIIYIFVRKKVKNYLSISIIICAFLKFFLEFLRMSHSGKIISVNQLISLIFIIIGVSIYQIKKDYINQ